MCSYMHELTHTHARTHARTLKKQNPMATMLAQSHVPSEPTLGHLCATQVL